MPGIFVMLESDSFDTGTAFFRRARDLGFRPVLLSTAPEKYSALAGFDRVKLPAMTKSAVMDAIGSLGRDRVCGVWSLRDYLTGLLADVAKELGRPGPDPGATEICCDKWRTRCVLAKAGLNGVRFALARSGTEAAAAALDLGPPVVVKPLAMAGGVGVAVCRDGEEARRHFDRLAKRWPKMRDRGALIEEAVEGRQFSVQLFDGRALGVTRQNVTSPPACVTVGLNFPYDQDVAIRDALIQHAEEAIATVGHVRGPGAVDLRHDGTRPRLIEINPRLAGDMIAENIRLATGIDLVEATIRFACGLPYDLAPKHARGSATRWLLRRGAPVCGVSGGDRAAAVDGVAHAVLLPGAFDRRGPVRNHRDRLGFVIADAGTAEEAGAIAERALRQLRIEPVAAVTRCTEAASRLIARVRAFVMSRLGRRLRP